MKPFRMKDKKTGEYRYGGQWLIKYRAPGGGWRRQVAGATKAQAEKALRAILTDIDRGTWVDPREAAKAAQARQEGVQTWGELVERFRAHYSDRAKNTRNGYEQMVRLLTRGREGAKPLLPLDTKLSECTPARLQEIRDLFKHFELALTTKNLYLTHLMMVFKWAAAHPGIPLDSNPAADIKRFRADGVRGGSNTAAVGRDEVFTLPEVQKMLAYAHEHSIPAIAYMLETAFSTGMRRGELIGFKWCDIDFERRIVHCRRNYNRLPKSGVARTIPMTPGLVQSLLGWKAQSPFSTETDYVFPRPDGRMRFEDSQWSTMVRKIAQGADVDRPELSRYGHLTRHTFATLYLRAGGRDIMLAKILGHTDTSLIHSVYAHFCETDILADLDHCGFSLSEPISEPISALPSAIERN